MTATLTYRDLSVLETALLLTGLDGPDYKLATEQFTAPVLASLRRRGLVARHVLGHWTLTVAGVDLARTLT